MTPLTLLTRTLAAARGSRERLSAEALRERLGS